MFGVPAGSREPGLQWANLESLLSDHASGYPLSLFPRCPEQLPKLLRVDVDVQLAGSSKVVLNHGPLQHCRSVCSHGSLVHM